MKTLCIVREGHWGQRQPESYDTQIATLKAILEHIKIKDENHPEKDIQAAQVEVIETADAAKVRLQQGNVNKIIFISRGMLFRAREFKKDFPRVEVVVLTGAIPRDEVIIVSNDWLEGETFRRILINDNQC